MKTNTPHTPVEGENWEEPLMHIMESYIMTAELGHLAKDQVKHKQELRAYYTELVDFIYHQLQKAREEKDKYYENILRHKVKEAWIQGNIISFEKPTYKSAFFDVESVFVLYPIVPDHSELDQPNK